MMCESMRVEHESGTSEWNRREEQMGGTDGDRVVVEGREHRTVSMNTVNTT
jgi:hypothetical protein